MTCEHSILGAVRQLPPHPDCVEGLGRLQDAGFRMAALTNSTEEVAEAQHIVGVDLVDVARQIVSRDSE